MTCRVFQWLISLARDRGREPAPFVRRHVADCAECRAFSRECAAMEEKLRTEFERVHGATPPTLHSGIMRAVRTSVPEPVTEAIAAPLWRFAAVLGVALVLVYAASVVQPRRGSEVAAEDEPAVRAQVHSQLSSAAIEAPALVSAPMEQEVQNLEDDVRRTTEYLLAQLSY